MTARRPAPLLLVVALGAVWPAAALAECPGTARLEEALLVLALANPVLLAEGAVQAEASKQRDWKMKLALGYDTNTTFETGEAGARAALRVEIPLFDRAGVLSRAEARAALVAKQDSARAGFLADIQTLCELAAETRALDTLRSLTRDRLAYRQERVNQGLDPADSLWQEAEAMQSAEHEWVAASGRLDALRLTLARRWGGEEWQRLHALLNAMTRR